jgi:RNA polymerase sigma factor (sigma-70 family)
MAGGQLNTFLRHLCRAVGSRPEGAPTDAQLLERFVRGRDEAAFELLVWRHGAMVLGVCSRVLDRKEDAEDAFQATFLTLVCKAGAIGKRESVGSWLYKVAYRIALRARASALPRPLPDGPLPDASAGEPLADLLRRELRTAFDEEVRRLPDRYRAAFVLCHLEGQTTATAARTLGCPAGTVGTRLARARQLLRRRLARRGFALAAVVGAGDLVAAPAAALVNSTVEAALLGAADRAAAAGLISAHAAALAKGALRTMSLTRWSLTAAVFLALGVLGGDTASVAHRAGALEPRPARPVQAALRPDAGEDDPGVVLRWEFDRGKPFYQTMTTETRQAMKVMNNDVVQVQKQTFYYRWTPQRREGEDWVLGQKVLGVRIEIDIGGNKTVFDSTKADQPGALSDFYKALVGAEFRVTLGRGAEVKKVEGRDELVKKLGALEPALDLVVQQVLTEDALRHAARSAFTPLPRGRLRPGDRWTRKAEQSGSPWGVYRSTSEYTYEGGEDGLDRIRLRLRSTLKPAPRSGAGGSPFTVTKGEAEGEGTGTILFDRARGRVVRLESIQKLEGELTTRIGGQETALTLSQTQKLTVRTTHRDPLQGDGGDAAEIKRLREENERLRRRLKAVEEALRGK